MVNPQCSAMKPWPRFPHTIFFLEENWRKEISILTNLIDFFQGLPLPCDQVPRVDVDINFKRWVSSARRSLCWCCRGRRRLQQGQLQVFGCHPVQVRQVGAQLMGSCTLASMTWRWTLRSNIQTISSHFPKTHSSLLSCLIYVIVFYDVCINSASNCDWLGLTLRLPSEAAPRGRWQLRGAGYSSKASAPSQPNHLCPPLTSWRPLWSVPWPNHSAARQNFFSLHRDIRRMCLFLSLFLGFCYCFLCIFWIDIPKS